MTDAGRVRYAGLAGAALVALASWLAGALPAAPPLVSTAAFWSRPAGPLGLAAWVLGLAALGWAWWRGRELDAAAGWRRATLALWAVPLLLAAPLGSRDLYSYACQGALVDAGRDPYDVGPAALPCPWLDAVAPLWRDTPAPYGPLALLLSAAAVAPAAALWVSVLLLRLPVLVGLVLLGWALPRLVAATGGGPGAGARAGWLVLGCPLVGVHLLAGGHHDALMLGLLVAGLALAPAVVLRGAAAASDPPPDRPALAGPRWSPEAAVARRWRAAGALLGAAVAVKATALLALPYPALAAGGAARVARWPAFVRAAVPLAAAAAATPVLLGLVSGLGLGWATALRHTGETTQWSSPPTAVGMTATYLARAAGLSYDAVPPARGLGVLVLLVVAAVLARRVWRGTTTALAAVTAVSVAAVLCAPVFYPWYAVWPLALLAVAGGAAARRGAVLAAAATALTLPDGTGVPALTKPLAVAVTLALGALAWRWWRARTRRVPAAA
ncbi:hypothetical protein GCM10010124_19480 [Pilimelia terevasa]|uniref:Alpha-1,6-mannosyltransferase n=1 Tax=Pilimelia terevasa TaxID=53372 RepID=A0A8J3FHQ9_9ACTN|nr:polyprenol phosphomannose-dependent alpha 1,6 mannosyltransferase MptB [Pilimelia terevasa]GGK26904.1 hypothetical protein GCM10010124_19480 [Pilimelia terevasa]